MITEIAGKTGRIHHAIQHKGMRTTRPCFCFVPEEFIKGKVFDKNGYLASRWPSANCTANHYGIGSHVLPDVEKPVSPKSRCQILREFLARLEITATIKIPTTPP